MTDELKYKWMGLSSGALALLLFGLLPYASQKLHEHPLQLPLSSLILQALFVALAFSLASASHLSPDLRLGLNPTRLSKPQWTFLLLGMLGLSQALDATIQLGGWDNQGTLAAFQEALRGLRGWGLAVALLGLGLAPAVGEEFLFRGLLLRGLIGKLGRLGALLVSSAAFGLMHFDPVHSVAAALIGLYLGIVLLRTGSLLPAMVCHAVNNVLAVVSCALWSEFAPAPVWQLPLGCAALAIGLVCTLRISPQNPHHIYREASDKPNRIVEE